MSIEDKDSSIADNFKNIFFYCRSTLPLGQTSAQFCFSGAKPPPRRRQPPEPEREGERERGRERERERGRERERATVPFEEAEAVTAGRVPQPACLVSGPLQPPPQLAFTAPQLAFTAQGPRLGVESGV